MSNTRKRRSAEEILAELAQKQQRLQERAKLDSAKANPALLPVVSALHGLNKAIAVNQRQFANGPQSFESRRKAHQLWLAEIDAAEAFATNELQELQADKEYLVSVINTIATDLVGGLDVTPTDIEAVLASVGKRSDHFRNLLDALTTARNARKAFKDQFAKEENAVDAAPVADATEVIPG